MCIRLNIFTSQRKACKSFLFNLCCRLVVVLLSISSSSSVNLTLYTTPECVPCRSVMIFLNILKLKDALTYKYMNLTNGDHLTPEFLKINPQHCLPTLVDSEADVVLWESHTILLYLHAHFAKSNLDFLYPKNDMQRRAMINRMLFYNAGTLYPRFVDAYWPLLYENKPLDDQKVKKLEETVEWYNNFINETLYCVGDSASLADFSLLATVSTMEAVQFEIEERFIWVRGWSKRCKTVFGGYWELSDPIVEKINKLYISAYRRQVTIPL